jgi:DNA-3-methyladenine glycosylase II
MPTPLTPHNIGEGKKWLIHQEPRFGMIFECVGQLSIPSKPQGFIGLLESIISQQLSTKAAKTIWSRLQVAGYDTRHEILNASDDALRALGLSRQKIRYAKALANASVDYDGLSVLETDMVIQSLIPIVGIGEWTAQMYALFALNHCDVFAPNDLGLQEGMRKAFDLPKRPSAQCVAVLAEPWSPWRSVASLALWAYNDRSD